MGRLWIFAEASDRVQKGFSTDEDFVLGNSQPADVLLRTAIALPELKLLKDLN